MFNLLRRIRRKAQEQLICELFLYNHKDDCFDPLGSVDRGALLTTIELIAKGKLPDSLVKESAKTFRQARR